MTAQTATNLPRSNLRESDLSRRRNRTTLALVSQCKRLNRRQRQNQLPPRYLRLRRRYLQRQSHQHPFHPPQRRYLQRRFRLLRRQYLRHQSRRPQRQYLHLLLLCRRHRSHHRLPLFRHRSPMPMLAADAHLATRHVFRPVPTLTALEEAETALVTCRDQSRSRVATRIDWMATTTGSAANSHRCHSQT